MNTTRKGKSVAIIFMALFLITVISGTSGVIAGLQPILHISFSSDIFGAQESNLCASTFTINITGTPTVYYTSGETAQNPPHIYMCAYGGSPQTFASSGDYGFFISISYDNGKLIALESYQFSGQNRIKVYVFDINTGTVLNSAGGGSNNYYDWLKYSTEIMTSAGTSKYWGGFSTYNNFDVWYYDYATNTLTVSNNLSLTGNYPVYAVNIAGTVPSTNSSYFGFVVMDGNSIHFVYTDKNLILHDNSFSYATAGALTTFDKNYPARVIDDNLAVDQSGTISGRCTMNGAPSSGNAGIFLVNFYFINGYCNSESYLQDISGGSGMFAKGNVWAYHINGSAIAICWNKLLYGFDYEIIGTVIYASNNRIDTINTVNSYTGVVDYPVGIYPNWIFEMTYDTPSYYGLTMDNYTAYWYANHGYPLNDAGNIRIEESSAFQVTYTDFYAITGNTVAGYVGGNGGNGVVYGFQDYWKTDYVLSNNLYYIKIAGLGGQTITQLEVTCNNTGLNYTYYYTIGLALYCGNTLENLQYFNIKGNGTYLVSSTPLVVVPADAIVRAGFVVLNDSVGVGVCSIMNPTYYMPYTNLSQMDFTTEENYVDGLSIAVTCTLNGGNGGGVVNPNGTYVSGQVIGNTSIVVTSDINGTPLVQPQSGLGTQITNMFISLGLGTYGGGMMFFLIIFGVCAGLFLYIGAPAGVGLVISFVIGTFVSWGIGVMDVTTFVIFCMTIILAGSFILGKQITGSGG